MVFRNQSLARERSDYIFHRAVSFTQSGLWDNCWKQMKGKTPDIHIIWELIGFEEGKLEFALHLTFSRSRP